MRNGRAGCTDWAEAAFRPSATVPASAAPPIRNSRRPHHGPAWACVLSRRDGPLVLVDPVRASKPNMNNLPYNRPLSARVSLVRVPGRLLRVVRAVVYFDDDRLFVGHGGPVHVSFRIAVKAACGEHRLGRCVFVTAFEAEHELIGG